jgi:hypothetical protein
MATYSELQTQFLGLLNRRDATTTQAQAYIQNAIQVIQRELRCPAMEKSVVATIDDGYVGLPIPTDFLELQNLIPLTLDGGSTVSDYRRMEKTDISRALSAAVDTGLPRRYCRQGGLWVLAPSPVVGDTIRIDYWAELSPLVNPTDTNVISIIASDLIVYKALSLSSDFFNDPRGDKWEARYNQIFQDLQTQADEDEESGAAVVTAAYTYPDDFNYASTFYPDWN